MNYHDRAWLIEHYVTRGLSCKACAAASGHPITGAAIHGQLRRHGIAPRAVAEHMRGARNPRLGKRTPDATRAAISAALTGHTRSEASRMKQSESTKGSKCHRFGKPRVHGRMCWVVRAASGGEPMPMSSRWEVYFADWLCENGRQWSYEPDTFILPDGSAYTPDFLCEGTYYEIKGRMTDENAAKLHMFRESHPYIKLTVLRQADLIALGINVKNVVIPVRHLSVSGPLTKECPGCRRHFVPRSKATKFCSSACVPARKAGPATYISCAVCGTAKRVYPSAAKARTTCSRACGNIAGAQKRTGEQHWSRRA